MDDDVHSSRSTLETNQKDTWDALRHFYAQNQAVIERSKSVNVGNGHFQEQLDQVLETSQVLLDGLAALANIHPVIGVAVFAFHGMIKLDITRRENNRKVLAVKLQVQSMMSSMFQLCDLKHVHILDERQKKVQREQLQGLIELIAEEIKQCGSDLSYYSDRKAISKFINAKIYERRFAQHVETFTVRRSELQSILTAYISTAIDAANLAIGHLGQTVEVVGEKIDSLLDIFQSLGTPSERDTLKFIKANGGVEHCLSNDDLLKALLTKSGQPTESEALADTRKTLQMELSEDLNKILSGNLRRFESQLVVQTNNLERVSSQIEEQRLGLADQGIKLDKLLATSISIMEEGKLVKKTIVPNAPIRLEDPELQRIWDGMGLSNRRSVKAKEFVLTLRDYLITSDHFTSATPELDSAASSEDDAPPLGLSLSVPSESTGPSDYGDDPDAWVLKHINVANMQPLIEAMDEDASGFISVQEANKFALTRPKGMKLLHWFAYWASGWHYTISDYRNRIYRIMQQLHDVSEDVLPINRRLCLVYLDCVSYFRIEGIIRHISHPASNVPRDSELVEVAAAIAAEQEDYLGKNLQQLSYVLRSPADVALVLGSGRLETWLPYLLALLLRKHLEILTIARSLPLQSREIRAHCLSLESVITVYCDRMRQLRDIFRPVGHDTEAYFKTWHDAYKWTRVMIPGGNTLLSFVDENRIDQPQNMTGAAEGSQDPSPIDTSILVYGPWTGAVNQDASEFDLEPVSHPEAESGRGDINDLPLDYVPSGIEGWWVGSFHDGSSLPFETFIHSVVDGKFEAKGRDYLHSHELLGTFNTETSDISIIRSIPGYYPLRFEGTYDRARDTIHGWWVVIEDSSETVSQAQDHPADPQNLLTMSRHTVSSFKFRHLLDAEKDVPDMNTARRRWAFATQSVLFDVQDRLNSWQFMRRRIAERNDWITLSFQHPQGSFNDKERALWEEYLATIHPSILAVYNAIAGHREERWSYDIGFMVCDVCKRRIFFAQYVCITCIEEDYRNWVGFCVDSNCSDQTTLWTDVFAHSPSHSLLRAPERIRMYEVPTIISRARILSKDIKKSFREATWSMKVSRIRGPDMAIQQMRLTPNNKPTASPTCSCCGDPVTLPCWVCTVCEPSLFLCLVCERKLGVPLQPRGAMPDGHLHRHYLLRINDSVEEKLVKQKSQDKRMDDMEAKFNNGLRNLEQKVDSRMTALETKMDTLMSLMHQMIQASDKGTDL